MPSGLFPGEPRLACPATPSPMSTTRRATLKPTAGPGLIMTKVPVPRPGVNDVLIKIRKTSICGTDVHINKWDSWAQRVIKPPLVIGHEYVGTVEDVGNLITGFTNGQIVTGEGHIVYGDSRNCLTGPLHPFPTPDDVDVHADGQIP